MTAGNTNLSLSWGAFPLSELPGQTHQFAKKMQQLEGTLA